MLIGFFFLILAAFLPGMKALAKEWPVAIKSCAIRRGSRDVVEVRYQKNSDRSGTDGNYYLFALGAWQMSLTNSMEPIDTVRQKSAGILRVDLKQNTKDSRLNKKFAVAVKKQNGAYELVSSFSYITNPEEVASYRYKFPTAVSKKGLQVNTEMISDAEDLGVRHSAVNIVLNDFLTEEWQQNSRYAYKFTFEGTTYWFSKAACAALEEKLLPMKKSNMIVTAILLMRGESKSLDMIAGGALRDGVYYYGLSTANERSVRKLSALMTFLAKRYARSGARYGRISNWVLGNEVENYGQYNYMGELSLAKYAKLYARSFRVVYNSIKSVYSNARIYISLSNCWNIKQPSGRSFTSRKTMEAFAASLKAEGEISWNLAFHPYPQPLTDPVFWDDLATNKSSTQFITMKNIGYLTDYLKRRYGRGVRVILSEQGFTSVSGGQENQELQAAAFAYAYYIAEFNDSIDAFILHRHVDNEDEVAQGLCLGLWSTSGDSVEWAGEKKKIWTVFRYIDTNQSRRVTNFALDILGVSSWSQLVDGFTWTRFTKMASIKTSDLQAVQDLEKPRSLKTWTEAYGVTVEEKGSTTVLTPKQGLNRNLFRGVGKAFDEPMNFSKRPEVYFRIKLSGTSAKRAEVKIRFYSGSHLYESRGKVTVGRETAVSANLSAWKYKNKVDKIQILVKPNGASAWNTEAQITIKDLQMGMTVG